MQPREMGKLLTAAVIAVGTFALAPRVFVDRLRLVDGQTLFWTDANSWWAPSSHQLDLMSVVCYERHWVSRSVPRWHMKLMDDKVHVIRIDGLVSVHEAELTALFQAGGTRRCGRPCD